MSARMEWDVSSWRAYEARQQPRYADPAALEAAEAELASYPALVDLQDTDELRARISEAQAGRAFLLQGGDCAESFAEFSQPNIDASYRLISGMASVISEASGLPVAKCTRMAGQFAKPRSSDEETKGGVSLPAYRGDIVNGISFDPISRAADPSRLFRAYAQAYATLSRLDQLSGPGPDAIFTCHEALLLAYEQALARPSAEATYASSAHFLWIGDRTRFPESAHVEFARGISNPLGIKCGPSLSPQTLRSLLDILNPDRETGRITLIARMGAERIDAALPPLLECVRASGHPVLWSCDPMHGNTIKAASGYKTRPFERILDEVRRFFAIVRDIGAIPGGIHVEMTGQDVTECTGGATPVAEEDLGDRYHTHCDPRLNPSQAMELAALVAQLLRPSRASRAA
jgi:3-deoxy-7-phosphoheptulonate synthase